MFCLFANMPEWHEVSLTDMIGSTVPLLVLPFVMLYVMFIKLSQRRDDAMQSGCSSWLLTSRSATVMLTWTTVFLFLSNFHGIMTHTVH